MNGGIEMRLIDIWNRRVYLLTAQIVDAVWTEVLNDVC